MDPIRPGSALPGTVVAPAARHTPPASPATAQLRKSATDFEALLIGRMLKTMRQSMPEGRGVFSGSGARMYHELMDEEMAKVIARGGGLGLGEILSRDLRRLLEPSRKVSTSDPSRPIQERTTPPVQGGREGDRHEDPR